MNENRPTKKQRELLSFVEGFIAGHGYGPSYREIMRAVGYKSVSTVAIHVDNLIKKGHLRKRDHTARSLEVSDAPQSTHLLRSQPVNEIDQKWLITAVADHFKDAELHECTSRDVDRLYVLVGALQVLGFEDAARSFKGRLQAIAATQPPEPTESAG